jgi:hypothetical protein
LYKKHLVNEGKNETGIYNILMKDYRKKHKAAVAVIQETGQVIFNARTLEIATTMVLRQMGLKP